MTLEPSRSRPVPPPSDLLLRAVARLLRPLVRLLIQAGVGFPALADLLRTLYVEVAIRDLLTDPQARTDSRVSVLTGVHRKEIRRRRTAPDEPEPPSLTLSSKVVARWLGTRALTDDHGKPLPLERAGPAPSFEALVGSVTTDVRPRALLDEWLDAGVASLDPDGKVRLEQAAFIPRGDREQLVFYFGRNLHDHIAAASANVVAPDQPRYLDRSVHYDGLSADAAARIEAAARGAAEATLLEVNRTALAIADADDAAGLPDRRHRVNLGVYVYAEEEKPSAEG
ncbi:MAG TPA: DUF6502 family protein [Acetobacteraceae bacterium]|nr:DUF6502 family protein [Acetobacteraceae bacterium]